LERLELGDRRPLRVDREPAAVGQHETELDHLAVDADIGRQHPRRRVRQTVATYVLSGPTLRRTAGEDRGEPPDDLALLGVARATLLIADAELLERAACAVEPLPQLFRGQLALRRRVAERPQLVALHVEHRSRRVRIRPTPSHGRRGPDDGAA